jgi:2-polyprenyl-3-methyl-5-hydroxy-6-metoxy-1,4-benzoquinol methylase
MEKLNTLQRNIVKCIEHYNINSIIDIGCGNSAFLSPIFQYIPRYIGADIYSYLIEENTKCHNKEYIIVDIRKDEIPKNIDLVICRDLLGHLSFNSIMKALETIKKSNAKYFLATTFMNKEFKSLDEREYLPWPHEWQPICLFSEPFKHGGHHDYKE